MKEGGVANNLGPLSITKGSLLICRASLRGRPILVDLTQGGAPTEGRPYKLGPNKDVTGRGRLCRIILMRLPQI